MRRRLPSTAALVAFEAAARHQSFTRAADELALTQSAVCRQIAALEATLAVKLFRRTRRGVVLTPAGVAYARKVAARLDALEADALDLRAGRGERLVVELAVVPTFATRWLLPRLAALAREAPQVQLNLHVRTRPFLFDGSGLDAAIYAGDGHWAGCTCQRLMGERLVAVASPALLPAGSLGDDVAALGRLPLLQQTTRPDAWRRWLAQAGVEVDGDLQGPRYELFSMSIEAAVQGLGVALVPEMFVTDELGAGRLVRAVAPAFDSDRGYYYVVPEGEAAPALHALGGWLVRQAAPA
jgi:LysR family glycine cleavage system transcriptional activator